MNGYRVRFEQGRGHFMVLERESPLRREEMDPVQSGMLKSCDIPGLLPLEVEEINGSVQLRYALKGSRMLSQASRAAKWSMEDAMVALCSMAETMEQCLDYMLDVERLALHDDYIFAGEGWHDLRFTYLPVAGSGPASSSYADDLERLLVRWFMRVAELDGTALQQLLRLVASPDFMPGLLRRYTRQYMAERLIGSDRPVADAQERQGRRGTDSPWGLSASMAGGHEADRGPARKDEGRVLQNHAAYVQPARAQEPARAGSRAFGWLSPPAGDPQTLSGLIGAEDSGEAAGAGASDRMSGMPIGRWRTWLSVGGVAASAMAWRFLYAEHPGQRGMLLAIGVTLGAIGACVYWWNGGPAKFKRKSEGPAEAESIESEGRDEDTGGSGTPPRSSGRGWGQGPLDPPAPGGERFPRREQQGWLANGQEAEWEEASAYGAPPRREGFERSYAEAALASSVQQSAFAGVSSYPQSYGQLDRASRLQALAQPSAASSVSSAPPSSQASFLAQPTGRLPHNEATVWLSGAGSSPMASSYLEWESGERKMSIPLQGASMIIGRSAEAAQHVDETNGISRAHLEMLRQEDRWVAKDLGSRNGTWLNGQPMTPYEPYPLEPGDQLQISSSIYRYRG
ncbi:DUF6382 domain-containing protein [Cohnella nanjingensis]|uniref:FHA domain-containing protein n=1 Tax=Cohnella nanjingensis TaxID=1387779 RepID=A0A7X0VIB7_9BACL|nr:DUF6382 domain-containing protein [Cohnella nanjingensis]MBB6674786.1 FHA domain-containing protein [Cohnella nanjingensis]